MNLKAAITPHHSQPVAQSSRLNGAIIEANFWQQRKVNGCSVTTTDVLNAYRNERSSLRSGFFLQSLFLKKIHHNHQPVAPEQVINEFQRRPGLNGKNQLAIARFQAACLFDGITLFGHPLSADAVADCFPDNRNGRLSRARFQEQCCLDKIPLRGQVVTPELVAEQYQALGAQLELAHFRENCCIRNILLYGQPVAIEAVVNSFPDTDAGKRSLARFKELCNSKGWQLHGKVIPPEQVLDEFARVGATIDMLVFKSKCCLDEQLVNGRLIAPETVIEEFCALIQSLKENASLHKGNWQKKPNLLQTHCSQTTNAMLGLARFKGECCQKELLVNGERIPPEEIVEGYQALGARLELARFRQFCCLRKIKLNGELVSADSVLRELNSFGAKLELSHFTEGCFLRGILLNGQHVSAEAVVERFREADAKQPLGRFLQHCCINQININGRPVSPDDVVELFFRAGNRLELAHFLEKCCLKGLTVGGSVLLPETVFKLYQKIGASQDLAHFLDACRQKNLTINGQLITVESVIKGYSQQKGRNINIAHLVAKCFLAGVPVNGQSIKPEAVIRSFPVGQQGRTGLAHFKEDCCLRGIKLDGKLITPETVVDSFPCHMKGRLGRARFLELCCIKGLHSYDKPISTDQVVANIPTGCKGELFMARFKGTCCLQGWPLAGRLLSTREVTDAFPDSVEGRRGLGFFLEQCCKRGIKVDGQTVTPEMVLSFMEQTSSPLTLACFKSTCCQLHLTIHGTPVTADMVIAAYPDTPAGQQHKRYFLEICCLNNLTVNGQQVMPEHVVANYEQHNQQLEKAQLYVRLALQARKLNGRCLSDDQVLAAFDQLPDKHTTERVDFLLRRLMALSQECDEAVALLEQAWQIIENASVDDEQLRNQRCVLEFLSIRLSTRPVTYGLVWQSIKELRQSINNQRLQFFFLAHCFSRGILLDAQPVNAHHLEECLRRLPVGNLRNCLWHWFKQIKERGQSAKATGELAIGKKDGDQSPVYRQPKKIEVYIDDINGGPFPAKVVEYFNAPPTLDPTLVNFTTRRALAIMESITDLRITGSFARWLQGIESSFNDIDLLGSQEAINQLIYRLKNQKHANDEITCEVLVQLLPGCPELGLPTTFAIALNEGDLGERVATIEASVYPTETLAILARSKQPLPWPGGVATCLPFRAEAQLLNEALLFLSEQLTPLTRQLLGPSFFNIPRTVLFNCPRNPDERVLGLLMRCLLTVNKARKFLNRIAGSDSQADKLKSSCDLLLSAVCSHSHTQILIVSLKQWLCRWPASNEHQLRKSQFIRHLLSLVADGMELPRPGSVQKQSLTSQR